MNVALDKLRPNPFRDFTLYPLDDEQVERLRLSIADDGFLASVTARPSPTEKGSFELAMGHHRVEACKRAGLTHVEIHVEQFDDLQMVRIMGRENLSQRGHNAAAGLDSVAAHARLAAFAVLAADASERDDEPWRILHSSGVSSPHALEIVRTSVATEGPGRRLIYRAMNGFDIDRKGDEKRAGRAEHISETEIRDALTRLKASGYMAQIVSWAQDKASALLAERRAAEEEAARQEEARRAAEVEKAAAAERKAQAAAEKKAKDAEEAREREAKAAAAEKEKARKETERAEKEANDAEAERVRLERKRETDKAEADKRAKADAEKRRAKQKADADAKERAKAVAAQKARDAIYDIRCDQCFRTPTHAQAFMAAVTSEVGRAYLPRENQLALAHQIRVEVDAVEKKRSVSVGSKTVGNLVTMKLNDVVRTKRDIDEKERQALLRRSATARVEDHWKKARNHGLAFVVQMKQLKRELDDWPFEEAMFPIEMQTLDEMVGALEQIKGLRDTIVGKRGAGASHAARRSASTAESPIDLKG